MASPFQFFHKYQKAFIAIAAVMAMFIFVVADPLMSYLQSGGEGQTGKTVVASWDGGSIDMQELGRLSERRFKISAFLSGLTEQAARKIYAEGGEPQLPASLPRFILSQNSTQNDVRQACVQERLYADLAKKSDISISDKFINHYLTEWGLRRMGDAEITALLKRARLTDRELFAGLRELLLGRQYQDTYALAVGGITPEQRWEDWRRINEGIKVEAAILPARDFVAQVPDPSEEDLRKFYEEHKERFQKPMDFVVNSYLPSPKPGFKIPRMVKVQYLSGNVEDRAQKLEDTITDEEIAAYYEENKSLFVKTNASLENNEDIFGDDEEDASDSEAETTEDDATTEETTTEESSTVEESAEESTEAKMTEEESVEESSSESETETSEAAEAEATASEETAEKVEEAANTAEEASEEAAPPADNASNRNARRSPFRLAAFQNEAEAETETSEEASTAETADEGADAEETAGESAEETETTVAEETDEATDAEATAEEEAPVEYTPLAEVSKKIRKDLARQKATIAVRKSIDKANAKLQGIYKPYGFKVVTARSENKEIPAAPATLKDYTELAKELDLTLTSTVPLSIRGVFDTDIGKTVDDQSGRRRVTDVLFNDLKLYQPLLSKEVLPGNIPAQYEQYFENNRQYYIVCKTEDIEAQIPEFEKIRAEVLTAWKNKEAAKLALAMAEELAKQAQESGDTIGVVARGQKIAVETSDMFSWFTFGNVSPNQAPRNYSIGNAPPLKAVDEEFMAKAFNLEADQKTALLNHDHSEAYAIQISDRAQTKQELRERFLLEGDRWFGRQTMDRSRAREASRRIQSKLFEEVGFNNDKLIEILSLEAN